MSEKPSIDKRVDLVEERLREELVDEQGRPADPGEVAEVVAEKAEPLADAPVQEFVPLLVEHQARDELRQRGLHREFEEDETSDAPTEPVDDEPSQPWQMPR